MRLEMLMGQWSQVEARCIECVRKRLLSNMIGELPADIGAGAGVRPGTSMLLKGRAKQQQGTSGFIDDGAWCWQGGIKAGAAGHSIVSISALVGLSIAQNAGWVTACLCVLAPSNLAPCPLAPVPRPCTA
jgi:hypothetical protein